MTTQDQIAHKTVVLHQEAEHSRTTPAYLLLSNLGHEVHPTTDAEQAVGLLRNSRVDLLVMDASPDGTDALVSRLGDLPADQLPREIAVFCDRVGDSAAEALNRMARTRVHLLLKPLHIHGLLGVLRKVEAKP